MHQLVLDDVIFNYLHFVNVRTESMTNCIDIHYIDFTREKCIDEEDEADTGQRYNNTDVLDN